MSYRAKAAKEYLAAHPELAVIWLLPDAPDLNPAEESHGNVKKHRRILPPGRTGKRRVQVDHGFARLSRSSDSALSFFRNAGLDVNQL
jgi:hypothetical protein